MNWPHLPWPNPRLARPRQRLLLGASAISAVSLILSGCPSLDESKGISECCDCLAAGKCMTETKAQCTTISGQGGTITVDWSCSNSHGCGPKCAAEGFKTGN